MEKIKLTNDEAKAIEVAKTMSIEVVVRRHSLDTESSLWEGDLEPLNSMTLHNILSAIYNGYEVERTPEDKILEVYELLDKTKESEELRANAIVFVLNTLNIKIEGINT